MRMRMRDLELEAPARAAAGLRKWVLLTGFYLLGPLPDAPLALKGLFRPRCILAMAIAVVLQY